MDNVIVAPHALGHTDELFRIMLSEFVNQITQVIHGEIPEGLVNREVWNKPEFQAKLKKFLESLKG